MSSIIYTDLAKDNVFLIWPATFECNGFHVYRQIGSNDYEQLTTAGTPILYNFYRDTINIHPLNTYNYKITYVSDDIGTEVDLTVATVGSSSRVIAGSVFPALRKITELCTTLGKAEYCEFLIKPRVGPVCPECYDEDLEAVTKKWCTACQNTGTLGGYISFADILTRFGNQGVQLKSDEMGYELKEAITCQIIDYPVLRNEDIIVRSSGERYFVFQDVRRIQLQGMLLKQSFTVKEVFLGTGYYTI